MASADCIRSPLLLVVVITSCVATAMQLVRILHNAIRVVHVSGLPTANWLSLVIGDPVMTAMNSLEKLAFCFQIFPHRHRWHPCLYSGHCWQTSHHQSVNSRHSAIAQHRLESPSATPRQMLPQHDRFEIAVGSRKRDHQTSGRCFQWTRRVGISQPSPESNFNNQPDGLRQCFWDDPAHAHRSVTKSPHLAWTVALQLLRVNDTASAPTYAGLWSEADEQSVCSLNNFSQGTVK